MKSLSFGKGRGGHGGGCTSLTSVPCLQGARKHKRRRTLGGSERRTEGGSSQSTCQWDEDGWQPFHGLLYLGPHRTQKKQQLCPHPIHLVSSGRAERQCLTAKDPLTFMDIDDVSAGATNGAAMLSLEAETIANAKHHYSCYRSAEKTFLQFEASEFFFAICFCAWLWG